MRKQALAWLLSFAASARKPLPDDGKERAVRKKLERKLRSNRGMTLILSLLFFLICAAAGSVALTAGTAYSGTVSERAKLDQRYFSVTSAAEFLRDKFDGQSVSVTIQHDADAEKWSIERIAQEPAASGSAEGQFVRVQSLFWLDKLNQNEPEDNQIKWRNDAEAIIGDAVTSAENKLGQYTLKAIKDDDEEYSKLQIKITVETDPSSLAFILENDNDDMEKFRLKMDYTPSVKKEVNTDVITYQMIWKIGAISLAY